MKVLKLSIKLFLIFIFFFSSLIFAKENKEEIFNLAVNEYKNNNYQKSLDYFLSAKEENSAQIFYNIANCYFKLDDFGHAVLYYKKALKIEPDHEKSKENLKFILSFIETKENAAKNNFMKKLFSNIYILLNFNLLAIISFSSFFLFVLFLRLSFNKRYFFKFCSFVFLIFFFLNSGFFAYKYWKEKNNFQAVVMKNGISCYSGPNTTFNLLFDLPEGKVINIIKKQDNWYLIEVEDHKTAWVKTENLEFI